MWKTILINDGEKLTVKDNWLVVSSQDDEAKVPIGDIYSIVVDNRKTLLSVAAITALTNAGVHILICDEKHTPVSLALPLNTYYRPLTVLENQLALSDDFKDMLWQKIVTAKIDNQCRVLHLCHINKKWTQPLERLRNTVGPGDISCHEGVAVKLYFRAIFGPMFYRARDDVTNAALNYGYTIIRSAFCKTLTAYGYNCVLGLHHINKQNPFNLADDMMEPLRPLVDLWIDNNSDDLINELTRSNRKDLINIINGIIMWDQKKMRVRYAIDKYISSLTAAIEKKDASLLKIPVVIKNDDLYDGDEGDE